MKVFPISVDLVSASYHHLYHCTPEDYRVQQDCTDTVATLPYLDIAPHSLQVPFWLFSTGTVYIQTNLQKNTFLSSYVQDTAYVCVCVGAAYELTVFLSSKFTTEAINLHRNNCSMQWLPEEGEGIETLSFLHKRHSITASAV